MEVSRQGGLEEATDQEAVDIPVTKLPPIIALLRIKAAMTKDELVVTVIIGSSSLLYYSLKSVFLVNGTGYF